MASAESPSTAKALDTAMAHVAALNSVVGDLVTRAQGSGRQLEADVDVVDLTTAAIERHQATITLEEAGPVVVRTQPTVLRHVLDLLVQDAISGEATIRVVAARAHCSVQILDGAGPGRPWPDVVSTLVQRLGGRSIAHEGSPRRFEVLLPREAAQQTV